MVLRLLGVFLAIVVLLDGGSRVEYKRTVVDYFEKYLNRKIVLLNDTAEYPSNEGWVCARYTVRIGGSSDMKFIRGEMTDEQFQKDIIWDTLKMQKSALTKAGLRETDGKAVCDSAFVEYVFLHRLPDGFDRGAYINKLDLFVIIYRKMFLINFPYSCRDEDNFARRGGATEVKKVIQETKLLKNGEKDMTVMECKKIEVFKEVSNESEEYYE